MSDDDKRKAINAQLWARAFYEMAMSQQRPGMERSWASNANDAATFSARARCLMGVA